MADLDFATMAYVAGVIDLLGVIRTRQAGGTELPYVAVSGPNAGMLDYLAGLTGTKATITRRSYSKAGCAQHCKEKHQHVVSVSGRWSVSGVKATVLLWNVRPYLRLQVADANRALLVGVSTGFKASTVRKMSDLGWAVPDFDDQHRKRG